MPFCSIQEWARSSTSALSSRFGTIRNKKQSAAAAELTKWRKKNQILKKKSTHRTNTRYTLVRLNSLVVCVFIQFVRDFWQSKSLISNRFYPGFCATTQITNNKKNCFNYMRFPSCNDSILFCTKTDSLTKHTTDFNVQAKSIKCTRTNGSKRIGLLEKKNKKNEQCFKRYLIDDVWTAIRAI